MTEQRLIIATTIILIFKIRKLMQTEEETHVNGAHSCISKWATGSRREPQYAEFPLPVIFYPLQQEMASTPGFESRKVYLPKKC